MFALDLPTILERKARVEDQQVQEVRSCKYFTWVAMDKTHIYSPSILDLVWKYHFEECRLAKEAYIKSLSRIEP